MPRDNVIRLDTHRPQVVSIDRFARPPVHKRIPDITWRDDLRDLWRDIVEFSHVLTVGIVLGCLGTVALAFVWSAAL